MPTTRTAKQPRPLTPAQEDALALSDLVSEMRDLQEAFQELKTDIGLAEAALNDCAHELRWLRNNLPEMLNQYTAAE